MKRFVLAGLIAAMGGCSKPAAPPSAASTALTGGTVVGKVTGAGGATAVVVLEPKDARTFPPQADTPVMDQAGLTFGPELLFVRTGQPVEFRNSDDTLHNVHVTHEETKTPAFNVAIPTGSSYTYTFELAGFYRVGCDIHPSMAASIFAAATPFTAIAEHDGTFTFDGVAPGAWTVTVYTSGRRLHKDVAITGGVTDVTIE